MRVVMAGGDSIAPGEGERGFAGGRTRPTEAAKSERWRSHANRAFPESRFMLATAAAEAIMVTLVSDTIFGVRDAGEL